MLLHTSNYAFNADEYTPIGLYLGLRNHFKNACLLESNDYHDRADSKSIIGLEPLVELQLNGTVLTIEFPGEDAPSQTILLTPEISVEQQVQEVLNNFQFAGNQQVNGFFGRVGFEFALLTEKHIQRGTNRLDLPDFHFYIFKYLIIIDHFKDQGTIVKNAFEPTAFTPDEIHNLLDRKPFTNFPFELLGKEEAGLPETEYERLVQQAIAHIRRGDVFQLVLANAYSQAYFGDDLNVYRELRRLNPSPYLFYFDFGTYRLFGSSPEAQLKITQGKAEIHPIAGTVQKTGNQQLDAENCAFLKEDEKENAEHTMLVDLARNDLSRLCSEVKLETYKEIQGFSHVFHIVSRVTGKVRDQRSFELFNQTFPAGTLSGAPKPKALELIAGYEPFSREFYGGAIGFLGASGDLNMAIVIRSVLSKHGVLHYSAGAGIVLDSLPEKEGREVETKLKAVRAAIRLAAGNAQKLVVA